MMMDIFVCIQIWLKEEKKLEGKVDIIWADPPTMTPETISTAVPDMARLLSTNGELVRIDSYTN
jgi:hypothetical protein